MNSENENGWTDLNEISREWGKGIKQILHEADEKKLDVFFVLETKKSQCLDEKEGTKYKLFIQKLLDFSEREKKILGYDTRVTRFVRHENEWEKKLVYFCPTKKICDTYLEYPHIVETMKGIEGMDVEMINMMMENAKRLKYGR